MKREKLDLLCLSQRNYLIRICELIQSKMGHVSSATREKSKIKLYLREVVTYKDYIRWISAK